MKKIFYLVTLVLFIVSCTQEKSQKQDSPVQKKDSVLAGSNYQHLVGAVNWYSRSAEMRACYYQAYNLARWQLEKQLGKVARGKKKAVVVDIDETLLNNTPFEIKSVETGKGYSKESWGNWTSLARASALPGALEFLRFAKSKNVDVFYITNRNAEDAAATIKNLDSLKFPDVDKEHFFFRADKSSKETRRKEVEKNYEILLLIGDNLADFSEVFENRSDNLGFEVVDQNKDQFGEKFIVLPNPMYGDWESALYGKDKKYSDAEKGKVLREELKSGY
jgi:5'-nucleotidase (lipoprotein e(P4) family)